MMRFVAGFRNLRLPAAAFACTAALCASASAQSVSDQLQIISGASTFTYTAYDPAAGAGFEPILAFASYTGGTQASDDYSTAMTSTFEAGSGSTATFNAANTVLWMQGVATSLKMFVLTEPGSSTAYSDVIFTFNITTGSTAVNAIALISDPTLVADLQAAVATYNAIPLVTKITPAMTAETGSLQDLTTFLYGSAAPYTVNVLSSVPEAGSAALMLAGALAIVPFVFRRRRH